jgi:hypothetical protein
MYLKMNLAIVIAIVTVLVILVVVGVFVYTWEGFKNIPKNTPVAGPGFIEITFKNQSKRTNMGLNKKYDIPNKIEVLKVSPNKGYKAWINLRDGSKIIITRPEKYPNLDYKNISNFKDVTFLSVW